MGPTHFEISLLGWPILEAEIAKFKVSVGICICINLTQSIDLENYALSIGALSNEDIVAAEEL